MALGLLACTAAAAALTEVIRRKGLNWTAEFATVGALVVAIVALFWPAFRKWWNVPAPVSQLSVDEAIERLSPVLLAQWANRNTERQVHDPGPMQVEFRVTQFTRSLMTTVPLDDDGKAGAGSVPADLPGNFDSILDVFCKVPRLVITGSAGSGKSVLCLKLAGDLLSRPTESRDGLPVILQASAWKPGESLGQWVARELTDTDHELSLRPRGSAGKKTTLAQALAASRVIPIIDGLDELPAALRGEAIKRINEAGSDRPLVVTSRPAEYTGALAAAGREVARAAVVEMQPLTLPIVQGYLREAATPRSLPRWQLLFAQLDRAPDGPLATALTNPLFLWLCRRIYSQDDRDAAELAERPDLGSRRAIENHLLDAFLPAIYRDSGEPSSPWTAAQARKYLGFLASYLEETRSPDLPWWRLQQTVRDWRAVSLIIRGASLSALACWLAVWILRRAGDWQDGSYTGRAGLEKLLLNGPAGPLIRAAGDRIGAILAAITRTPAQQRSARPPRIPGVWLVHDVVAGLNTVPWPLYVIFLGAAVFTSVALDASTTRSPALIASIRLRYSLARTVGTLVGVCLLAGGIVEALLKLPHRPAAHAGSAAGGLFIVAAIAVACLVPDCFRVVPADPLSTKNPVTVLRGDRHARMCAFPLLLILLVVVWCCCGPAIAAAVGVLVGAYLLSELVIGPTGSGAFVATRAWLALTHRMPLRTLTFLEDAHERGALSRTGSVYQFRHLQLQRHLARERIRLPGPVRTRLGSLIADNYVGLPTSTEARKQWALWFKDQADALTDAVGPAEAAGPVYKEPPGVAQRFGSADGRDWVMCALPDRYPVLVADSIWTLLHDLRAATDGGDALRGLGFPTRPLATPARECLIGPDTVAITLADGYLGPATLDRADDGKTWCWHPQARFHVTEGLRSRQQDESGRIEVEVVLPCRLSEAAVGPPSAWHLEPQLRVSAFAAVIHELAPSADGYPSGDSAADPYRYRWRSDASRAPSVDAVISVSASPGLEVTVRLDITAGPRPGTEVPFRLGLSLQQIEATIIAAWQTAADILPPAILSDPLALLNGRPAIHLTVSAHSTPEEIEALAGHPRPRQADSADARTVTERTVTIRGPVIGLSDADRQQYVRDALGRLPASATGRHD